MTRLPSESSIASTEVDAAVVLPVDGETTSAEELAAGVAGLVSALKPGGHVLVFGNPWTYHRLACAVEDAGLEVRDAISWMEGRDGASRIHQILLARKPLIGTVAGNVLQHGTGALNIKACRVASETMPKPTLAPGWASLNKTNAEQGYRPVAYKQAPAMYVPSAEGRWPTNVLMSHSPACSVDMCVQGCPVQELGDQSSTAREAIPSFWRDDNNDGVPVSLVGWLLRLITQPGGSVWNVSDSPIVAAAADSEGLVVVSPLTT